MMEPSAQVGRIRDRAGPDTGGYVDVAAVRREFGGQLRRLREAAGFSLKQLSEHAGYSDTALNDLERGKGSRPPNEAMVIAYVEATARRLPQTGAVRKELVNDLLGRYRDLVSLLAAAEQHPASARSAPLTVAGCRPEWVGVHATDGPGAPPYIPRDHDEALRERLRDAAAAGGFVVLVGESSSGKTRSLLTALQMMLPEWNLVMPHDANAFREVATTGAGPTIIWLDDTPTERFVSALRRSDVLGVLHRGSGPVVIVDALWPDRYAALTAIPRVDGDDPYRDAREVLASAGAPFTIPAVFSPTERTRAAKLAAADDRLARALADSQFGVTQVLAGAPELVRRWEQADPYTGAVITAAIDLARLGIVPQFVPELLAAAGDVYLSDRHRGEAGVDWFAASLRAATTPGLGTVVPLHASLGPDKNGSPAYVLADYLVQYGRRHRFFEVVPDRLWQVLLAGVGDGAALLWLGKQAHIRRQYAVAREFYLRAIQAGDADAPEAFVRLASEATWKDELRKWADAGDYRAGRDLAEILAYEGRIDELREIAETTGHATAISQYVDALCKRGDSDLAVAEAIRLTVTEMAEYRQPGVEYLSDTVLPRLLRRLGRYTELDALAADGLNPYAALVLAAHKTFNIAPVSEPESQQRETDQPADESSPGLSLDDVARLRAKASSGDNEALTTLIDLYAAHAELEELCCIVAASGEHRAWWAVLQLLNRAGDPDRKQAYVRYGLTSKGSLGSPIQGA
jgi:transcriptional regulator with XRE-family HTH domain